VVSRVGLFYGYVRSTEDLDIAVNPDRENLDRVADALTRRRGSHLDLADVEAIELLSEL